MSTENLFVQKNQDSGKEESVFGEVETSSLEGRPAAEKETRTYDDPSLSQEALDARSVETAQKLQVVRERLGLVEQKESDTSSAEGMWEDERFKEMKTAIEQRRPDKFGDRATYEALVEFRRQFPDEYARYKKMEEVRIYRNSAGEPSLALDRTYNQADMPPEVRGGGIRRTDHVPYLMSFARMYPVKARAYAETNPTLKSLLERSGT